MERFTLPIYNTQGQEVDTITLDEKIFDGKVNTAAIHQAIRAYRANQRKGLASTKTMGEVSGGGSKPWRQKGTGRARVGSIRSPLWRHGGVIFGPHPRDFSYNIPQKIKTLALKSSINVKLKENNFVVVEEFFLEKPKTKEAVALFSNLKLNPPKDKGSYNILLILDKIDNILKRSLRNISFLRFNNARDVNAYDVLAHKKLLITKDGLNELINRLKK